MSSEPDQIDAETVKAWMDAGEAVVVDVREDDEVAAARIPGAVHLALSRFDPSQIPPHAGKKLVFSCASGMRSDHVARQLLLQGFVDQAANLEGGIQAWARAGLPVET
ncbi:MAG: rhodanese-like domain-containing protein [Rhodospirillales bacterium]